MPFNSSKFNNCNAIAVLIVELFFYYVILISINKLKVSYYIDILVIYSILTHKLFYYLYNI